MIEHIRRLLLPARFAPLLSLVVLAPIGLCQDGPASAPAVSESAGFQVSASLVADGPISPGGSYSIRVTAYVPEDWRLAGDASVPLLQILPPPSVTLYGPVLKGLALLTNKFVHAPYEVVMKEGQASVHISMAPKPAAGERIEFNVLTYVRQPRLGEEEAGVRLLRRRMALRLVAGAEAETIPSDVSEWGELPVLQLGDAMPAFTLPRTDGTFYSLSEDLGQRPLVISTYLAHW